LLCDVAAAVAAPPGGFEGFYGEVEKRGGTPAGLAAVAADFAPRFLV